MFNPNQAANVNPNFPGVNTLNQDLNGRFSGLNPLSQAGNGNMSFPGSNAPNQGSNIGGLSANLGPNLGSNLGGFQGNNAGLNRNGLSYANQTSYSNQVYI